MVLSAQRGWRERLAPVVVVFVIGTVGTFYVVARAFALVSPEASVFLSLVGGALATVAVDRLIDRSLRAIRVARLGTAEDRMTLLATDGAGNEASSVALVAIEHGDLGRAALLVESLSQNRKYRTPTDELATLRYHIACRSLHERPRLLDELIAWRATALTRMQELELERYRAFVVAWLHEGPPTADKSHAIAKKLLAHRDEQVRGYATWIGVEMEDLGLGADTSHAFAVGAALARHHGREELAKRLDARASKAAGPGTPTPYRD